MLTLSISVVLYSSDMALLSEAIDLLSKACLHAARKSTLVCRLDLVNNNPDDKNAKDIATIADRFTTEYFLVQYLEAGVNGGYGAGNNISIRRHTNVDYHLVLNPDVLIEEDALTNALAFLEANRDVGLLTPQVKGLDGMVHHLCKRNPTLLDMFIRGVPLPFLNRFSKGRNFRYAMHDHDYQSVIKPVPYPTGCFMLFRRSVLTRIGGFDEGYFLHYEDADIGRSVNQVSQAAYVPSVVILHKWSRDTHKSWHMRWVTIKSGLRYWRKWGGIF